MRAAHSPRRSRGPLLLAAAVCAGLLYAAARRPSGTELPAAPQSYIEGVALATSPWPKLQARQGAGCSAILLCRGWGTPDRGQRACRARTCCRRCCRRCCRCPLSSPPAPPPRLQNISDLEVLWELPPAPMGVLFVAHGCSHSGSDFWPKSGRCMHCLGLPEEMWVREAALRRGYAVVAVSSHNRETQCWHNTGADKSEDLKVGLRGEAGRWLVGAAGWRCWCPVNLDMTRDDMHWHGWLWHTCGCVASFHRPAARARHPEASGCAGAAGPAAAVCVWRLQRRRLCAAPGPGHARGAGADRAGVWEKAAAVVAVVSDWFAGITCCCMQRATPAGSACCSPPSAERLCDLVQGVVCQINPVNPAAFEVPAKRHYPPTIFVHMAQRDPEKAATVTQALAILKWVLGAE